MFNAKTMFSSKVSTGTQGLLGLALIAIWWPIAWLQVRPLSDHYFFPLWLGYILTIDGLVERRTGTSLWRRSRARFALLFLVSIPFWWIFEWLNQYLQNWHYTTPRVYSQLEYALLASLAFSTVVPAVLEMTELLASFGFWRRLNHLRPWALARRSLVALHLLGWIMLALVIAFPRYAFPLTWLSVYFIVEPINVAVGQRSIGSFVRQGAWRPVALLMLAAIITGFFWEMWNVNSMPKWTYAVPFVEFAHVFEMPLLGYLGYLPFGLEIFSLFALIFWLIERKPQRYVRVGAPD